MARLTVNGRVQSEDSQANWGILLQSLDEQAGRDGHVVTAVRFDGVDQPTFRQPVEAGRRLGSVTAIEIETSAPADLLDDVLAEGAHAATTLAAAAAQTAAAYRTAGPEEGNHLMAALGEGLRSLLSIVAGYAAAREMDLHAEGSDGRSLASRIRELVGCLEPVVQAQQEADWLTVADLLDYEVQPALEGWGAVFERLRAEARGATA